jgi:hypothetical protein
MMRGSNDGILKKGILPRDVGGNVILAQALGISEDAVIVVITDSSLAGGGGTYQYCFSEGSKHFTEVQ